MDGGDGRAVTVRRGTVSVRTGGAVAIVRGAAIPADAAEALRAATAASRSPATVRAYGAAWRAWEAWARGHGMDPMPAAPEHVAAYLAHRAAHGACMATLRMATAAIAAAHGFRGRTSPCRDRAVSEAMRGIARVAAGAGRAVRQARGLTAEAVAAIRGSLGARADTPSGALTMAIASVTADAGLRRSEAAALLWGDIVRGADGSGRITVRRSKTDREGEGAVVAVTAAAMDDLDRLAGLRHGGTPDPEARVFGIGDRQISRRIAAAARDAGLGEGFSGHSGRVGMALRMTRNGAPAATVMRQGRWSTTRMVARYTRNEAAGEALRYL